MLYLNPEAPCGRGKIVDNVWSLYSRNLLTEIQAKNKSTKFIGTFTEKHHEWLCLVPKLVVCWWIPRLVPAIGACECSHSAIQCHSNWEPPIGISKNELYVTAWLGPRSALSFLDSRLLRLQAAVQGSWGFSCCQPMYMSCAPLNFNGLRPTRKCSELALGGASFKKPGLRL